MTKAEMTNPNFANTTVQFSASDFLQNFYVEKAMDHLRLSSTGRPDVLVHLRYAQAYVERAIAKAEKEAAR